MKSIRDIGTLRASTITAWELCPQQWAARYYYGHAELYSKYLATGTAVHELVEAALHGQPWDPSKAPYGMNTWLYNRWSKIATAEQPAVRLYLHDEVEGYLRSRTWLVEYQWRLPGPPGAPDLSGTMDVVAIEPDGTLLIVDHKTNRRAEPVIAWQEKVQPRLYAYAARRLWRWGRWPEVRFRIGYTLLPGKRVEWSINPEGDANILAQVARVWSEMVASETHDTWEERLNPYCRSCPLATSCATYLDRTAIARAQAAAVTPWLTEK